MPDKSQRPNSPDAAKDARGERAYTQPELIKYGVLADITAAVGKKGMMDGATMAPRKTGF